MRVDAVMIGTTHFANAFVERKGLPPGRRPQACGHRGRGAATHERLA